MRSRQRGGVWRGQKQCCFWCQGGDEPQNEGLQVRMRFDIVHTRAAVYESRTPTPHAAQAGWRGRGEQERLQHSEERSR